MDAPMAIRYWIIHPQFTSQKIWVMDKKEVIVSDEQCMSRNSPVGIYKIKQMPKWEPKFHHDEIFDGTDEPIKELFVILISGRDFWMLVINVLIVEI